jgi:uncharacterized protein (TIGR02444 family)
MSNDQLPLWDFSVALYAHPSIERACLQLQDHWQVNVNILLWVWWLEARHISVDAQKIVAAQACLTDWDAHVLTPLRAMRREIKRRFSGGDVFVEQSRQAIKSAELAAEQVEQQWLEHLAMSWIADSTVLSPGANLVTYLQFLKVPDTTINAVVIDFLEAPGLQ